MKKTIRYVLYLATVLLLIFLQVRGAKAASVYNFTKAGAQEYTNEEILVFSENISYNDISLKPIYSGVKEIRISEGVTSFDWDILSTGYFPNLETISIPATLTKLTYNGFAYSYGSSKLKAVNVAADNTSYVSENGCLFNKNKTILLKYTTGSMNTSYTIPDTVTTIKKNAFMNAANLETVTIGAKVERGQLKSIMGQLRNIREFKVSSKNTAYSARDGVLFDKKGVTLFLYPNGKGTTYSVPKGTLTILRNAFYMSPVKKVILPQGLKTISSGAFAYCKNLTSITIPKSVTKMDKWDFSILPSLETFYIESGSKIYASYKGILYDTARTKIVFVPMAYNKSILQFPSTLKSLDLSLFYIADSKEIIIPKALTELFPSFQTCFEKITLEKGNQKFVLYKGSLYDKGKTNLYLFKNQEKGVFPDTLEVLTVRQFMNSDIKELVIPPNAEIGGPNKNIYDIATLQQVTVAKDSKYYILDDGMLLSRDRTILYDIPKDTRELKIPDTVTQIEPLIFSSRNLLKIWIPGGVKDINTFYIRYMKSAEYVEVDSLNGYYTSIDGVLYNKDVTELLYYPMMKQDKSYIMPDTVKTIDDSISLTTNPYLESITLSKALEYADYKFAKSNSLKEIKVSEESSYYKSVDGVLYNKDMTVLLDYPYKKADKTLIIPDSVLTVPGLNYTEIVSITEYSYYVEAHANLYLENLVIGKNVKELFAEYEGESIWGLKNLQNISVNEENPYFSIRDGILYNKDFTAMFLYSKENHNTLLSIPAGVKYINNVFFGSLINNRYLTSIEVKAGNQNYYTDGVSLYNYRRSMRFYTIGDTEYPKVILYD